MKKIFC